MSSKKSGKTNKKRPSGKPAASAPGPKPPAAGRKPAASAAGRKPAASAARPKPPAVGRKPAASAAGRKPAASAARPAGRKTKAARARSRRRLPVWVLVLAGIAIIGLVVVGVMTLNKKGKQGQDQSPGTTTARQATIETAKGPIVIEVYPALMPVTCANFIKLVEQGFYKDMVFHRVEDWVIQTGDPTGTGTSGSGQTIKLETNPQLPNVRGAVGMARSQDPNTATSQFYILRKDARTLDGNYAIFGKVVSGLDVVDKIALKDAMPKVLMTK
jgi:peptidyl-prolyl cis-trans isomerase B (cyclophilin B)